jgi:hypothetical protein
MPPTTKSKPRINGEFRPGAVVEYRTNTEDQFPQGSIGILLRPGDKPVTCANGEVWFVEWLFVSGGMTAKECDHTCSKDYGTLPPGKRPIHKKALRLLKPDGGGEPCAH